MIQPKKAKSKPKPKGPPPAWAERLRAFRIMTGKNQTKFAAILGISQPRLSQYESGEREPDFVVLNLYKLRFGASIDFIVCGTGPPITPRDSAEH